MSTPKKMEDMLVKPPHTQESWTEYELREFAKCADPVTGPRYFMNTYFYIQHPTKGSMVYTAFEFQEKLIDTYHENRFSISLMPRQTGKCVTKDINITIKNNTTGDQYCLPIGIFYEFNKAKQNGTKLPNISEYKIKNT